MAERPNNGVSRWPPLLALLAFAVVVAWMAQIAMTGAGRSIAWTELKAHVVQGEVAEVIHQDMEVDRIELDLDEACHATLARNQPTAIDLRFLIAVMKITNDLERIGDSAVNIAQSAHKLMEEPPLKPYIDLPKMSALVRGMVREALDAFVRRDSELATKVLRSDDTIDALYRQLFRELLTFMIEDPKTISRALHLLLIARNLERIADHATNIAEDVIYLVEGEIVRHRPAAFDVADG